MFKRVLEKWSTRREINVTSKKPKRSAVLLLLYEKEGKICFPLIQRPIYDGTHGGQISFPGGKFEHFDESLERTALREAQEEIGIKAIDVKIIGELTEIYIQPSNFLVKPFVGTTTYKPEFYPDPVEVESVISIELDELFNVSNIQQDTVSTKYGDFDTTVFKIQDKTVWGATALILAEFMTLLKEKSA